MQLAYGYARLIFMAVSIEVSWGELIDRITILEIKRERLTQPEQLATVARELDLLAAARDVARAGSAQSGRRDIAATAAELRAVNEALWDIEDDIRACEASGDFGPRFVELARAVYRTNDRRAALKRQISLALGSDLLEEKSYASYS